MSQAALLGSSSCSGHCTFLCLGMSRRGVQCWGHFGSWRWWRCPVSAGGVRGRCGRVLTAKLLTAVVAQGVRDEILCCARQAGLPRPSDAGKASLMRAAQDLTMHTLNHNSLQQPSSSPCLISPALNQHAQHIATTSTIQTAPALRHSSTQPSSALEARHTAALHLSLADDSRTCSNVCMIVRVWGWG